MVMYAVTLGQVLQGMSYGSMWKHLVWGKGHDVFSTQATGTTTLKNYVDLDEHCWGCVAAARIIGIFSGI